ncbi:hypothetical protein Barb4_02748 [Bacteroidales bacterium Barb4]|nr:hypothetical protein Barb4_02748 [Bacteroidales bacterium Barb4]
MQSICEGGDNGTPAALRPDTMTGQAFYDLARQVVKQTAFRDEHLRPTLRVQVNAPKRKVTT